MFGADWRRPTGPEGPDAAPDHPAVHIAYVDALAYADWTGKSLPTEAEWEYAARGGLEGATYSWGDDFQPDGQMMAKTWSGVFPTQNDAPAGLERTSPVRSYPPNGFGLYDMIGNVWEWTSDWYAEAKPLHREICCGSGAAQPEPDRSVHAQESAFAAPRRVVKGGSHLCAPSYCQRYRPAARMGAADRHFGLSPWLSLHCAAVVHQPQDHHERHYLRSPHTLRRCGRAGAQRSSAVAGGGANPISVQAQPNSFLP